MLATLNGLILAFVAGWIAVGGGFGLAFAACGGLSALFWVSAWCAGRHELRPLVATWIVTIGAFLWSLRGASFGLFEGAPVYFFAALYLVIGLIVSVILHRETREQRRRQRRALLERKARG
ncbi:MAG: hypothetical protein WDN08_15625 [Rhizomicrobium sp.]